MYNEDNEKLDKLGRRIPQFDRSKAGKKAAKTAKETLGADEYAKSRSKGGQVKSRGYFGYLKDTNPKKLEAIIKARNARMSDDSTQEKTSSDEKGETSSVLD